MIAIIDYDIGNLRSVQKAMERLGGDARIVRTPQELGRADKIVLPGVAAFGDAMDELRTLKLVEPLTKAIRDGLPYLGFCLGLQLLFEVSYEDGEHRGLGVFPGKVERFDFSVVTADGREKLSVPHMGWNQLDMRAKHPMFDGIQPDAYVYFAHSYHVVPDRDELTAATTTYGYEFTSAIAEGNIFATQFHPEKSQSVGLRLLENFVRL